MEKIGYRLLDLDNNIIEQWGGIRGQIPGIPNHISLPNGDIVHAPEIDVNYSGYKLVEWFFNPSFSDLKTFKLQQLADIRWQKETGGTIFNGYSLATDVTSQTKYIGAVVAAQIDPTTVVNWKMKDGTFVELDADGITAVSMAVRSHVQACFDREAELKGLIDLAETEEDLNSIDISIGWPNDN